jgi:hypothetical protein
MFNKLRKRKSLTAVSLIVMLVAVLVLPATAMPCTKAPTPPNIVVSISQNLSGVIGKSFSCKVSAKGGAAPYSFTVTKGSLPPGLNLANDGGSTGTISGVPLAANTYSFTITATDANGLKGSGDFTMTVVPPTITLTLSGKKVLLVGKNYSFKVTASGGTAPYGFDVTDGSLPPGLNMYNNGNSTATITGVPTVAGPYAFTITATDAYGCLGKLSFTIYVDTPVIMIRPGTLSLTQPVELKKAHLDKAYTCTVRASGGTAPYTFTVTAGALPIDLTLDNNGEKAGIIEGIPVVTGASDFTITATDAYGTSASDQYEIQVVQ